MAPLHRRLAEFNRLRLLPSLDVADWQRQIRQEAELRIVEGHLIEAERAQVRGMAYDVPTQPRDFVRWFESLGEIAALQAEQFHAWLADTANRSDLSWVLSQELAGESGLEDLVALTQVELPWRAKLAMARNYWDEMGQGDASAIRGLMLDRLSHKLHIESTQPPVWESLARGNLMLGLATNRRYAFQSIGALGALELLTPDRATCVAVGLGRLGFPEETAGYFAARAKLCALRSHAYNEEVILPIVAQDSRTAAAIAEGALLRFAAEACCLERYRRELGLAAPDREIAYPMDTLHAPGCHAPAEKTQTGVGPGADARPETQRR